MQKRRMGVENFSKNDLTAANLPELVRQLREAVTNKEYATIEDFAKAFAAEITTSMVEVVDGKRTLEVNGERVDVSEVVGKIMPEIDKTRGMSETDPAKVAEYEAMYTAVDSQLTALFMQDKMMEELASRGFSAEKYAAQAVAANARSDEKIQVYDNKIKAYQRIQKKVLEPRDVVDGEGNVKKVSLKTQLQDEKDAKVFLEGLSKEFVDLKNLEDAIAAMEAEITADPTKEVMYRGKIDANKALVAQKTADVQGKVKSLKDLNLTGFNVDSLKNADDVTKMSRDAAKAAVDGLYATMDTRILEAYRKIEANLGDRKKAGEHTFTPEEIVAMSQLYVFGAEETGMKAVDAALSKIENEIARNTKFKAQEEALKIARTKSTAEYAKAYEKQKEILGKYELVQKRDADGNRVYIDADGHETIQSHDEHGNPYQKKNVAKLKLEAREQYLEDAGIDVDAEVAEIKADVKREIENMSRREGRALLKSYGIGNWFTRMFAYRRLMSRGLPALVRGEAQEQVHDVKARAEEVLAEADRKDREEGREAMTYTKATEKAYAAVVKDAATHREMANGAYENNDVLRNRNTNMDVVEFMDEAALEETSLVMARALLEGSDLTAYKEARQRYTHKVVAREHNDANRDYAQNPQHKDVREEREER